MNVRKKCESYFFKGSMGCWNKMKMMKGDSTIIKGINIILAMELENYEDKCDMMIGANNSCMGSPMIH
jgi:hypothetical protein